MKKKIGNSKSTMYPTLYPIALVFSRIAPYSDKVLFFFKKANYFFFKKKSRN